MDDIGSASSEVSLDDFKFTEEQQKHFNSLATGVLKAGYKSKLKRQFAKDNNLEYYGAKKKEKAKKANTNSFQNRNSSNSKPSSNSSKPKSSSEMRSEIMSYAAQQGYSPIKSLIDMVNERDKKGEYVLPWKDRKDIHKELAKYEAPALRSSDLDDEANQNPTVVVKNFEFNNENNKEQEKLPSSEYEEFEYIPEESENQDLVI